MCADRELDLDPIRDRIRGVTGRPSAIPQGAEKPVRDLILDALELLGEIDRLRREQAYHLAMAELWREGELRWFPGGPGSWPPQGIVYEV